MIRYLVDQGIVVNDVLDEKKDEELKQSAREAVQPVMIFQGEIIVREGNQIDASAMKKLELLGLTNQTTSIFPLIAMVLAVLLQIGVLIYNSLQFSKCRRKNKIRTFLRDGNVGKRRTNEIFQLFPNRTSCLYSAVLPRGFCSTCFKLFLESKSRDHGWYFSSSIRTFHFL